MNDIGLLILRLTSGGLMLSHGMGKIQNYGQYVTQFADPIGLGMAMSLNLVIFAEVVCAIMIVLGLFSRLALIPAMINMAVAAFIVHGADPFAKMELALIYLLMYLALFFTGPGQFSLQKIFKISAGRFSWLLN